jgi:oxygen-independent coproporphyrinogen-3 oxidase
VRGAYAAAREAGFENVSLDLIYAVPGQSLSGWRTVLDEAVAMAPEHLSLYALSLVMEPDAWSAPPRAGALRWRRRRATEQDDGLAVAQYRLAEEVLAAAGYDHYELSSWARPGRASRHNGAYWARRPYTGLGAGAHSFDGVTRSWNVRDLDRYLADVAGGQRPLEGSEALDPATREWEAIALGLRRVGGFSRAAFAREFGEDPLDRHVDAMREARDLKRLEIDGDVIRLSAEGRLVANDVLLAFLP